MISIQPIWVFLAKDWEEMQSFLLTQKEMIVLNDIVHLLNIFNTVQGLLSASKQPVLPLVIPAYEYLIHLLKHFCNHGGCWFSHAIDAALCKINKYLLSFKLNPLYGIATGVGAFFTLHFFTDYVIALHPAFKLTWIEDADGVTLAKQVEESLLKEVSNTNHIHSTSTLWLLEQVHGPGGKQGQRPWTPTQGPCNHQLRDLVFWLTEPLTQGLWPCKTGS